MLRRIVVPCLFTLLLLLSACGRAERTSPPDPTASPAAAPATPVGGSAGELLPTVTATRPAATATATVRPDPLAAVEPADGPLRLWYDRALLSDEAMARVVQALAEREAGALPVEATPFDGAGALPGLWQSSDADERPTLLLLAPGVAAPALPEGSVGDWAPFARSTAWGWAEDQRAALQLPIAEEGALLSVPVGHRVATLVYEAARLEALEMATVPATLESVQQAACDAAPGLRFRPDAALFAALVAGQDGSLMRDGQPDLASDEAVAVARWLQESFEAGCAELVLPGQPTLPAPSQSGPFLAIGPLQPAGSAPEGWAQALLPHAAATPVALLASADALLLSEEPAEGLAAWLVVRALAESALWAEQTALLPALRGDADEPLLQGARTLRVEPLPAEVVLLLDEALVQIIGGADAAETLADVEAEARRLRGE